MAGGRPGARLRAAVPARRRGRPVVGRPRRAARALRAAHRVVVDLPRLRCGVALRRDPRATSAPTGSWPPGAWPTPSPTHPRCSRPRTSSPWTGTTRCSPARSSGEAAAARIDAWWDTFVMDGRGRALRVDRPVGDRGGDGRVRARPRRRRASDARRWTCSPGPGRTAATTARTGPGSSTPRWRRSPRRAHHLHRRRHRPGRRRAVRAPRRRPGCFRGGVAARTGSTSPSPGWEAPPA